MLKLLEFNEVNFGIVQKYVDSGYHLPNWSWLLNKSYRTSSEQEYQCLEPWVQWPSIHTGLPYDQHKLFRLGDGKESKIKHIYEMLEKHGLKVGALSPMNAPNNLNRAAFFMPDPWTGGRVSGGMHLRLVYDAVRQAVNDNSQDKVTVLSKLKLLLGMFGLLQRDQILCLVKYFKTIEGYHFRKAIFLDLLLFFVYSNLCRKTDVDFSSIFLNSIAHIQHHYFFNCPFVETGENPDWYMPQDLDPLHEALVIFDDMIASVRESKCDFIVATGLQQRPYDRSKFYYRLKAHKQFMEAMHINCIAVEPRMTRDMEVYFANSEEKYKAIAKLKQITLDGKNFFGDFEERENSIFLSLTYPDEIFVDSKIMTVTGTYRVYDDVAFVAIKNGMHDQQGYVASSCKSFELHHDMNITKIFSCIEKHFDLAPE